MGFPSTALGIETGGTELRVIQLTANDDAARVTGYAAVARPSDPTQLGKGVGQLIAALKPEADVPINIVDTAGSDERALNDVLARLAEMGLRNIDFELADAATERAIGRNQVDTIDGFIDCPIPQGLLDAHEHLHLRLLAPAVGAALNRLGLGFSAERDTDEHIAVWVPDGGQGDPVSQAEGEPPSADTNVFEVPDRPAETTSNLQVFEIDDSIESLPPESESVSMLVDGGLTAIDDQADLEVGLAETATDLDAEAPDDTEIELAEPVETSAETEVELAEPVETSADAEIESVEEIAAIDVQVEPVEAAEPIEAADDIDLTDGAAIGAVLGAATVAGAVSLDRSDATDRTDAATFGLTTEPMVEEPAVPAAPAQLPPQPSPDETDRTDLSDGPLQVQPTPVDEPAEGETAFGPIALVIGLVALLALGAVLFALFGGGDSDIADDQGVTASGAAADDPAGAAADADPAAAPADPAPDEPAPVDESVAAAEPEPVESQEPVDDVAEADSSTITVTPDEPAPTEPAEDPATTESADSASDAADSTDSSSVPADDTATEDAATQDTETQDTETQDTETDEPAPEPDPDLDALPPLSELPERGAVYRASEGMLYLEGPVTAEEGAVLEQRAMEVLGPERVTNNYIYRADALAVTEGNVRVEQAVLFETGSSAIADEFIPTLELGVLVLTLNPQVTMVVEGHTDEIGSAETNLALSEERAQAVVEYLVSRGVDRERLVPVGLGETMPVAPNDTEAGRQLNRRIEVNLIDLLAERPDEG